MISFFTGLGVGVLFAVLKLPIPAPNKLEGVLGILGIFAGYILLNYIKRG